MTERQASYSVTPMIRGGFRAECFVNGCEWWADFETEADALTLLRIHMRRHRITISVRAARAGTQ